MSELSYFWPSDTGDGQIAPYNADTMNKWFRILFTQNQDDEGVVYGLGNELQPIAYNNGTVTILTGTALVHGSVMVVNSAKTIVLTQPTTNPRIDIIVVRKDWTTKTIRLAIVEGAEAATPTAPTLDTIEGNIWEMPLAQVQIETDLSVALTDLRVQAISPLTIPNTGPLTLWKPLETEYPTGTSVTMNWSASGFPNFGKAFTLRIVGIARSTQAALTSTLTISGFGVVGNAYYEKVTKAIGTATLAAASGVGAWPTILIPGASAPAGYPAYIETVVDLPLNEVVLRRRSFDFAAGFIQAATANDQYQVRGHCHMNQNGELTFITYTLSSGNFAAGTRFSIYEL